MPEIFLSSVATQLNRENLRSSAVTFSVFVLRSSSFPSLTSVRDPSVNLFRSVPSVISFLHRTEILTEVNEGNEGSEPEIQCLSQAFLYGPVLLKECSPFLLKSAARFYAVS